MATPRSLSRVGAAAALFALLYVGSYLALRSAWTEAWERDGHRYVIFPNAAAYYAYRPLELFDAAITELRFHIGPHR